MKKIKPEILRKQIALIKETKAEETETKRLQAELIGLRREKKYGKQIAIVKTFGSGVARVGRGLAVMGRGILKGARESKGLQRQYEQMYGKQPRQPRKRIAIVKKRKKSKKQKQVKEKYVVKGGVAYPIAITKKIAIVKRKKRKR